MITGKSFKRFTKKNYPSCLRPPCRLPCTPCLRPPVVLPRPPVPPVAPVALPRPACGSWGPKTRFSTLVGKGEAAAAESARLRLDDIPLRNFWCFIFFAECSWIFMFCIWQTCSTCWLPYRLLSCPYSSRRFLNFCFSTFLSLIFVFDNIKFIW